MKTITAEDIARQFSFVREILQRRAEFLASVRGRLNTVVEMNKELFRRAPEARLKTIPSILRKMNADGAGGDSLEKRLVAIEDVAGLRLTIATQDQYEAAGAMIEYELSDSMAIKLKKSWRGTIRGSRRPRNGPVQEIHNNGYCADHYVVTSNSDETLIAELQVRTLAHDLWAVFSHYETYKAEEPASPSRVEEVKNYSRLMDVADYYATQIRHRKEEDANEHHKRNAPASVWSSILTVDSMRTILGSLQIGGRLRGVSGLNTMELCDLLRDIGSHQVYTKADFRDVIGNYEFLDLLRATIEAINQESNTAYKMESAEALRICAYCRNVFKREFRNRATTTAMRDVVRGLVAQWHLTLSLNDRASDIRMEHDGHD